jgi:hypothetical protein
LKLDGVVNIVDALNFKGFDDTSFVAKTQAKFVDLVIINKTGLVDNDTLYKVEEDIYDLYYKNPKVKTADGNVDKDLILGLDHKLFDLTKDEKDVLENSHHHEDINIKDKGFSRIKGVIRFEDGAYILNYVFGRFDWIKLEKYAGDSKMTFMGNHVLEFRIMVEERMESIKSKIATSH